MTNLSNLYGGNPILNTSESTITNNAVVRGDGGGRGLQESTVLISDNGEMINASQPHFEAYLTATQSNVTGDGTIYPVLGAIWTESIDVGGNFSNGTFTAPVSGRYLFTCDYYLTGLGAGHTLMNVQLVTSNNTYYPHQLNPTGIMYGGSSLLNNWSIIAYMDVDDTAFIRFTVSNSTKTVAVGANYTIFAGTLLS